MEALGYPPLSNLGTAVHSLPCLKDTGLINPWQIISYIIFSLSIVVVAVMNCSFDNPKSSGLFPRLHNWRRVEQWSRLYGNIEGMIFVEYSMGTVLERGVQCEDCTGTKRIDWSATAYSMGLIYYFGIVLECDRYTHLSILWVAALNQWLLLCFSIQLSLMQSAASHQWHAVVCSSLSTCL